MVCAIRRSRSFVHFIAHLSPRAFQQTAHNQSSGAFVRHPDLEGDFRYLGTKPTWPWRIAHVRLPALGRVLARTVRPNLTFELVFPHRAAEQIPLCEMHPQRPQHLE